MVDYAFIKDNIDAVREKIGAAAARSGRKADEVTLMAVSKFHPVEAVEAAYACGLRRFGENRVQEAEAKYLPELYRKAPELRLDMIGTLQSNKINKAMKLFDCIQSVSSLELLKSIIARSDTREKPLQLFLELHTGEESKSGFPDTDRLFEAVEAFLEFETNGTVEKKNSNKLFLSGLMTMAPFTDDERVIRSSFRTLASAKEEIGKRFALPGFEQLSMGMSGDFEIAIEEGSTLLRVGTAIFGARE